jgi:L-seryl-tRNA(Ser) seleniumtransferase
VDTKLPQLFRKLPSVDDLIHDPALEPLIAANGREATVDAARDVLTRLREEIASGSLDEGALGLAIDGLRHAIETQIRRSLTYSLQPVINATGVILHTNLARAPISRAALDHIAEIAAAYCNLEFDIPTASRGRRDVHVDRLFQRLLQEENANAERPALSTIVVNNNAAAVLLALNTLGEEGEVIVSRGELVEIGGSFRIPDVMKKSGAILREVGTTNRTRISDYENAINDKTRLLLRVHRSNFEITGFTEQPTIPELVALSRKRGIPFMEDLGSGALFDLRSVGISGEPGVLDSLCAGVNVVTYSGDKLLGGPQAGLISGSAELIARMRSNSLFRALRVDKLVYAALEATLLAYAQHDHEAIPALRMMRLTKDAINGRAEALHKQTANPKLKIEIIDGESLLGGGSAPSSTLPTRLLAVTCEDQSADDLAKLLRTALPPIIARVDEGRVLLDLRTVFPEQDAQIAASLNSLSK